MARSKRNASPSSSLHPPTIKRRRQNTPPKATTEIIEISSSDDEPFHLSPPKGKGKEKAPARKAIVILSSPSPSASPIPTSRRWKGKGKTKAVDSAIVDVDTSETTFETEQGNDYDHQLLISNDGALARKLAREWAAQDQIVAQPAPNAVHSSPDPDPRQTPNTVSQKDAKASFDIPCNRLPLPEPALAEFKALLGQEGRCSKCKKHFREPQKQVVLQLSPGQTDGFPPSLGPLLHATCSSKSCQKHHCRGCLKPVDCPPKCLGPIPRSACSILSCCTEGRAIALYEVLAGFDEHYLSEKATSETRTQANLKLSKGSGANSVGPGGTGYGTGVYLFGGRGRGRGRGAAPSGSHSTPATSGPASNSNAVHWDETVSLVLRMLTDLLPAPCSNSPEIYDLLPHPSLAALILTSYIPTLLAELLRNDSVTDWIARNHVYHAMLALLRRMADSELIIQVLVGHRPEIFQSDGLGSYIRGTSEVVWQRDDKGAIELAVPLLEHFKKLTKQSETFLQAAAHHLAGGDDETEFVDGLSLCGDIIAGRDDIARAMAVAGSIARLPGNQDVDMDVDTPVGPSNEAGTRSIRKTRGRPKAETNKDAFNIEKEYVSACERLGFAHTALSQNTGNGLVYSSYNYAHQLSGSQSSTRSPKDRLHLVKELAVMATSLPPGIWVRVDEVRNDAIKVMIAGPQGTPYSGGLFEFDVFMPLTYPKHPPSVHLRTTGRGSVRFNPNLYNCGKVCLSLLGTWPGSPEEQWSSKSTLLQVLVSIQSMILNEAPYFNEPGHGKVNAKSTASVEYNRNTALQTVRWAIVEWLNDEHRDGIWASAIKSHFTTLEDKIRKQILEWAKDITSICKYSANQHGAWNSMPPPMHPSSSGAGHISNFILPPLSVVSSGLKNGGKAKAQQSDVPRPTMDLVEQFELGMNRLESWNPEED